MGERRTFLAVREMVVQPPGRHWSVRTSTPNALVSRSCDHISANIRIQACPWQQLKERREQMYSPSRWCLASYIHMCLAFIFRIIVGGGKMSCHHHSQASA